MYQYIREHNTNDNYSAKCEHAHDKFESNNALSFQPYLNINNINISNTTLFKPDICLYIHIPFCTTKCYFCSIETRQSFSNNVLDEYIDALIIEIEHHIQLLLNFNIICIHFGGGTPSILSMNHLQSVFSTLNKCVPNLNETEVVFEANPNSIDLDKILYIASRAKLSLNIGIQTFNEKILNSMHRRTNINGLLTMLCEISKMNLYTIGIDLICNLPFSKQNTTIDDIDIATKLGVNHFSIYPLRIELNSKLYSEYSFFSDNLPSGPFQIEFFNNAKMHLLSQGFEHYSIFHYSKANKANNIYSRQQLNGGEWIGYGAGANSYYNCQIIDNISDISKYIIAQKSGLNCIDNSYSLRTVDIIIRELAYILRKNEINKTYILNRYGNLIYNLFIVFLREHKNKYIQEYNSKFELKPYGIMKLSLLEKLLFNYLKNHFNSHQADEIKMNK